MAFASSNLTLLDFGGNFMGGWVYKTTADTLKTVASATATGYFAFPFNSTGNVNPLSSGDILYVVGSDGQGTFRVVTISTGSTSGGTSGSSVVTLAPIGPVYAAPAGTTSANIVPYGVFLSTLTSTTTFTLDMPWAAGQVVHLSHVAASTAVTVLMASTAAGAIGSTGVQILFNAANQAVTLVGRSTSAWAVVGSAQPGTAIIGPLVT